MKAMRQKRRNSASALEPRVRRWGISAAILGITMFSGVATAAEVIIGGTGGVLGSVCELVDAYHATQSVDRVVILPSLGSGGGIKALRKGELQVAVSGRPLKAEEATAGLRAEEFARSPFVVGVHRETKVDQLSVDDIARLIGGDTSAWADGVRVRIVLRPLGDSDTDMLMALSPAVRDARLAAEKRPGMLFAVSDQEAADLIEKSPGAIGMTMLSLALAEKRAIKILPIQGTAPIVDGRANPAYPYFKRWLFVTAPNAPEGARRFIAFVRSSMGRDILMRTGNLSD